MKRCMIILLTLVPASVVAAPLMRTKEQLCFLQFVDSLIGEVTCEDPCQRVILDHVLREQVTFAVGYKAWQRLMRVTPVTCPLNPVPIGAIGAGIAEEEEWLLSNLCWSVYLPAFSRYQIFLIGKMFLRVFPNKPITKKPAERKEK